MYPNYPGQNPFNPYQGNAMGQQFSRTYQSYSPPVQPRPNPSPIEVYQVSSIDEAKAQIANPVAPTLFCNFGQSEIYVKHIDNNGQGQFHVFHLVVDQPKQEDVNPWVPIMQRLENIEQLLGSKNDVSNESNAAASSAAKSIAPAASSLGAKSTTNAGGKI